MPMCLIEKAHSGQWDQYILSGHRTNGPNHPTMKTRSRPLVRLISQKLTQHNQQKMKTLKAINAQPCRKGEGETSQLDCL